MNNGSGRNVYRCARLLEALLTGCESAVLHCEVQDVRIVVVGGVLSQTKTTSWPRHPASPRPPRPSSRLALTISRSCPNRPPTQAHAHPSCLEVLDSGSPSAPPPLVAVTCGPWSDHSVVDATAMRPRLFTL
jgi:hypothetical protein